MTPSPDIVSDKMKEQVKESMNAIKHNIRSIMLKNKIQDEDLAYMIGSNRSYINYLLNRRSSNTSIEMLVRISLALGISLSELVDKKFKPS